MTPANTRGNARRGSKKRTNNAPNEQEAKRSKGHSMITRADSRQVNAQDYFTGLPDLCLLEVFKHLPRGHINIVSSACEKLRNVGDDPAIRKIKFEGIIKIYQTRNGYGFQLISKSHQLPCGSYASETMEYEIVRDDGKFIETKRHYPGFPGKDRIIVRKTDSVHTWPVPPQFTSYLIHLMRERNIDTFTSNRFPTDGSFYAELADAMEGQSSNGRFYILSTEPVTDNTRMRMARVAKTMKSVYIGANVSNDHIINEAFLKNLGGGKLSHLSSAVEDHPVKKCDSTKGSRERLDHFFHPKKDILPHLIGYECLEVPTMNLQVESVAELVMSYINHYKSNSDSAFVNTRKVYQFSMDRPLSSEIIGRQLGGSEFQFVKWDDGQFDIFNNTDKIVASISSFDYTVEDQRVHGLQIRFVVGPEFDNHMTALETFNITSIE